MATDQQIQNDSFLSRMNQALYDTSNGGKGLTGQNRSDYADQMLNYRNMFSSSFKNLVGRDPTSAELDQFTNQYLVPNAADLHEKGSAKVQDPYTYLNQFISNNFQGAAKDYATQQLTQQQGQANDLANLFRTQGQQALNTTENSLLDYQQKLFEKLRPQLLTSLQSQGLLDTGGLNTAVAGAQKDLANSVQPWLAQQQLQNEQQANAIAFSGASAPLQYQQSNILNSVPYLQSTGQQAMNQGYNTFLTNLNFQNQLALQNNAARLQADAQPSFLRTLGQGFAGNLGGSLGYGLGAWTNPAAFSSGSGGTSGAAGLMHLVG